MMMSSDAAPPTNSDNAVDRLKGVNGTGGQHSPARPPPFQSILESLGLRLGRGRPAMIPLVVQVGFAGSRSLFDLSRHPDLDAVELATELLVALEAQLQVLPARLGLSCHHLLCGVSQVAVGADTLFTRACSTLGIRQRILLPQPRDDYLTAQGSDGTPDFTIEAQREARTLLDSGHIIEECVVSHATDRSTRFEETNSAILRASDVLVCLVREGADSRRGGTEDLIRRAEALGKPVARMTVAIEDSKVKLSPLPPVHTWSKAGKEFVPPSAPPEFSGLAISAPLQTGEWPSADGYTAQIKAFASWQSKRHRGWFKRSAVIIIVFHLAATVLAIFAGKNVEFIARILLSAEFLLLIAGLFAHFLLHHGAYARVWAVNRLVAEAMRSLAEIEKLRGDVGYPLELPVPQSLLPILRTSAVLRLRRKLTEEAIPWEARREAYVKCRLDSADEGQLVYYEAEAAKAKLGLVVATSLFGLSSACAIGVTGVELLMHFNHLPQIVVAPVKQWGEAMAIFMPVAAVGFLSWSAATDLEARAHTFAEMHSFLIRQRTRLSAAGSEREFNQLVREAEWRLLGENLGWFWRRSFTNVT